MKFLLPLLTIAFLSSQSKVDDMKSITSSINIRDLKVFNNQLIFGSAGGIGIFNEAKDIINIYNTEDGLIQADVDILHIGPNNNLWIGNSSGVQVWDLSKNKLIQYFQSGIESVVGFSNYKDMVYSAVKIDGKLGIMEFIFSNSKIYFRDFYFREELKNIKKIATFGENLLLLTSIGLISGNPHKTHIKFWEILYNDLGETLLAFDARKDILSLAFSNRIYSIKADRPPITLFRGDEYLKDIIKISIADENQIFAISDSVFFVIRDDKLEIIASAKGYRISSVYHEGSTTWVGSNYGFFNYRNNIVSHFLKNEPYINAADVILHLEDDRFVMANNKGISLSGWSNISFSDAPLISSEKFNLTSSPIEINGNISNVVKSGSTLFFGLKNSPDAGILSVSLSDRLSIKSKIYPVGSIINDSIFYNVSDIAIDKNNNIWALSNNNQSYPLSVFNNNKNRHISISESDYALSNNAHAIAIDNFNRLWVANYSNLAMYSYSEDIMIPSSDKWVVENIDPFSSNRIPYAISVSKKNKLWIATQYGLIYKDLQVSNESPVVSTGPSNANGDLKPYFSGVPFSFNTRIKFDPRGNIWINSSGNGIFILTEEGEYWPDINGINTSNSYLLSNIINDISFDEKEGLAYIATSKGVSVLRIPFALEKKSFSSISVFPNPYVIPNINNMTITGLKDDSSLQIMALNGVVVKSINSANINGYQGFWNGKDKNGNLVGSGIYYLTANSKNGDSEILKFAVIRK